MKRKNFLKSCIFVYFMIILPCLLFSTNLENLVNNISKYEVKYVYDDKKGGTLEIETLLEIDSIAKTKVIYKNFHSFIRFEISTIDYYDNVSKEFISGSCQIWEAIINGSFTVVEDEDLNEHIKGHLNISGIEIDFDYTIIDDPESYNGTITINGQTFTYNEIKNKFNIDFDNFLLSLAFSKEYYLTSTLKLNDSLVYVSHLNKVIYDYRCAEYKNVAGQLYKTIITTSLTEDNSSFINYIQSYEDIQTETKYNFILDGQKTEKKITKIISDKEQSVTMNTTYHGTINFEGTVYNADYNFGVKNIIILGNGGGISDKTFSPHNNFDINNIKLYINNTLITNREILELFTNFINPHNIENLLFPVP